HQYTITHLTHTHTHTHPHTHTHTHTHTLSEPARAPPPLRDTIYRTRTHTIRDMASASPSDRQYLSHTHTHTHTQTHTRLTCVFVTGLRPTRMTQEVRTPGCFPSSPGSRSSGPAILCQNKFLDHIPKLAA